MYIHFAHDDKFIDYFIKRQQLNFSDTLCKYVIITTENHLHFVKSNNVEICVPSDDSIIKLVRENKATRIYIHFFAKELYKAISQLPKEIKVYWMFWGADGTSFPGVYHLFLDDFSRQFYENNSYDGRRHKLLNRGFFLKSTWLRYFDFIKRKRAGIAALRRVDFFCHYIEDEFIFLKRKFKLRARFIEFNYCSIYDLIGSEKAPNLSLENEKTNATIGNSGCEANNHFTLLNILYKHNVNFSKIYCPLSYSEHPVYQKQIIEKGHHLFGDRFVPLTKFLKKEEYHQILESCSSFFHNHYRPQAYGNVAYQLYIGSKVYMNPQSLLYKYLSIHGLAIGTISDESIEEPKDVSKNQQIIKNLLSEAALNRRYENVLK
jgi:hypothetical protein